MLHAAAVVVRPPRLLVPALWLLAAVAAQAAEDQIDDIRLEYAPLLGRDFRSQGPITDVDPDLNNGSTAPQSGTLAFNSFLIAHRRWALSYYHSLTDLEADRGSFLFGASAAWDTWHTEGGSYMNSRLVDLFAGFAWAFTPSWHIEEGLLLGGGRSYYRNTIDAWWEDGSDLHGEGNGWTYEYGARIGTYYTLSQHVQAGLDLRYLVTETHEHIVSSHTNTNDGTFDSYDMRPSIRVQGFGGTLAIGWRL